MIAPGTASPGGDGTPADRALADGALDLDVLVLGSGVAGLSAVAQQHHVLAHGMSAAFALAAIFDVVTLVLFVTVIRGRRPRKVAVPDSLEGAEFAEEQALIE